MALIQFRVNGNVITYIDSLEAVNNGQYSEVNEEKILLGGKQAEGLLPQYRIDRPINPDSFKLGYIRDTLGALNVDQVSKMEIEDVLPFRFNVLSTKGAYWFSFVLVNPTDKALTRIVRFDEVYMEEASIHYREDNDWYVEHGGLSVEMEDRLTKNRAPVFLVTVAPNSSKTIYLRLKSKFKLSLGIVVESLESYLLIEQVQIIGYWFFFGAAIAIFLYNFFLLLSLRQRVYLFYCSYSLCFIIFSFLYSGFSLYIIKTVWLHYDLHFTIALTGTFISFFSRELLQTKSVVPKLDKVILGIAYWYLVLALLIVIDIRFYHLLVLSGMPTMLFLFFVGVYFLRKKHKLGKFYVVAMSGYLFGLSMIALVNLGAVPYNFFTRYGYLLGSLIEMTVFSLALAYRVKLLQNEKAETQRELLNIEQKNKEKLIHEVDERTKELKKSSEKVSQQRDQLQSRNENIELLLKEIHHRVKNNLQVVSSLLDLQSRDIDDEEMLANFMEGQNRVKAMALIHQKLYQNDNLATIDFADYAEQLMKELATLYPSANEVKTNIAIKERIEFDIDTAIPLGLILNELISNAYKYAFKPGIEGELNVSVKSLGNGKHELTVADSGVGLPEGFDFNKVRSLGLRLVRRLSQQLYGKVEYMEEQGARFVINFIDTVHRKEI